MAKAEVNGVVLAESAETEMVEGNHYFPKDSVNWDHFTETDHATGCPWKGTANYYSVEANGDKLENVAWQYKEPKEKAANIKDYVAFYPQVTVTD